MKKISISAYQHISTLILIFVLQTAQAQELVYIDDNIANAKMTLKISDEITFPDIKVVLGRDISFEDFSVGITNYKNQAHFIIARSSNDAERLVQVNNCDNFPDLSILVQGEGLIPFPDVKIEFRDNFADVLIYTEKTTISEQELIACLLPMIREKAGK